MKTLGIILSGILLSTSALAAEYLQCLNPSTGAEFDIINTSTQGRSPTYYTLNQHLAFALSRQGSSYVLNNAPGTIYSATAANFQFSSGMPKGYSLHLASDSGGMKLTYITYTDYMAGRHPVEFFFNPGECRFH